MTLRPTVGSHTEDLSNKSQLCFHSRCTLGSLESALMLNDAIHPYENCRPPKVHVFKYHCVFHISKMGDQSLGVFIFSPSHRVNTRGSFKTPKLTYVHFSYLS